MILRLRPFFAITIPLATVLSLGSGCGDGTIQFGGGGGGGNDNNPKVTFAGNINSTNPVTTRDIVVFVYNLAADDETDRCPCPAFPTDAPIGKATVLQNGETDFTVADVERATGKFEVIFLLDNPGTSADGQINEGDPIAILDDVDCDLNDVDGNLTVTLKDVDVEFSEVWPPVTDLCTEGDPPASGRARADQITRKLTSSKN